MSQNYQTRLQDIVAAIASTDSAWLEKARERTGMLVMPPRALGRLHDISEKLCAIQKTMTPGIEKKAFLVMAGDHGVAKDGVSAFPQEVTGEMVKTFLAGGAGINVLSDMYDAKVYVVDMGIIPDIDTSNMKNAQDLFVVKVGRGTQNIAKGPAMGREEAAKSIVEGFNQAKKVIDNGTDILGTGDMGIGNTTPSAAIASVITGIDVKDIAGRGTGVDDLKYQEKKRIIQQSIDTNHPDPKDGLDVLAKVGGFEIGGIAGIVLACAFHSKPVMVDGFISTAGALIAHALCPSVTDYMFCGHCSEEAGHRKMIEHLGLAPILDLGLRLGEGTGGALAMGILEGSIRIFKNMMTFAEAGVSEG